ncbi:MAG: hemin uptake protein HemP [Pseudomonadota bacterium]
MNMQILRFDDVDEAQFAPRPPRHEAEALTKGNATAEISLGDQIYCLRITRAGKLLLTK